MTAEMAYPMVDSSKLRGMPRFGNASQEASKKLAVMPPRTYVYTRLMGVLTPGNCCLKFLRWCSDQSKKTGSYYSDSNMMTTVPHGFPQCERF